MSRWHKTESPASSFDLSKDRRAMASFAAACAVIFRGGFLDLTRH
jgi:hypothetical protein